MNTPPSALHLLVADDVRDAVEPLVELLILSVMPPVTVDIAYDGAEAVAYAIKRPPAVAVLDIDMPVMTGTDAALAIRTALGRKPVLVAMTGYALHAARIGTHLAFDHVLIKPIDLTKLLTIINKVGRM
jgi:CheY-like chemotaxis protein